jgi:type IV secretory pathway VirB10-like protein
LSALTAYQIPVTNQGQQVIVQAYGSNIASLSGQILEKNINLKPKVTLPAGQRILISPQRDIWFKKPERREVQIMAFGSATATQRGSNK